jgi:hypothetical protein
MPTSHLLEMVKSYVFLLEMGVRLAASLSPCSRKRKMQTYCYKSKGFLVLPNNPNGNTLRISQLSCCLLHISDVGTSTKSILERKVAAHRSRNRPRSLTCAGIRSPLPRYFPVFIFYLQTKIAFPSSCIAVTQPSKKNSSENY